MSSDDDDMQVAQEYEVFPQPKNKVNQQHLSPLPKTKKLTMGLDNYNSIKNAHLKHYIGSKINKQNHKQYTFQPNINKKSSHNKSQTFRTFKKFIIDQQKFVKKKQQKINKLKLQINKTEAQQLTCRPIIDPTSNKIVTEMMNGNHSKVFQRLNQHKTLNINHPQQTLFSPKILPKSKDLNRKEKISQLLYSDAQRRISKEKFMAENINQKRDVIPTINTNANKLVKRKIHSQFKEYIEDPQIPPIIAITTLSQIFNVDLNPNKSLQKQQLCQKVLKYLLNEGQQVIKSKKLWNFIQVVINSIQENNQYNNQQIQQIYHNFSYFYLSRLAKQKKTTLEEKPSFKPFTLPKSNQLAQKHRDRVLTQINQFVQTQNIRINSQNFKIEDLFIVDYMKKKVSHQKKKIQNQNNQLSECSFRPKIINNFQLSNNSRNQSLKRGNNNLQTHQISSLTQGTVNSNIPQKSLQPHLPKHSSSKRLSYSKQGAQVKNMDKAIFRMSLGRRNREFTKSSMDRGYPKEVQNWDEYQKNAKKSLILNSKKANGYQGR